MSITVFFENALHAKLANSRWSWGATDPQSNRVYLRVWEDQIEPDDRGKKVQIYWNQRSSESLGYDERLSHLATIRKGAQAIGIVCRAKDPNAAIRRIASFDGDRLLRLGQITEDGRGLFAHIDGYIPIGEIHQRNAPPSELSEDISAILRNEEADVTTKEALVDARIGQGKFRAIVLQRWNNRCAVTGSAILEAIRASHIKPWRESTNMERLDPMNGIPLVASLDALFDAGLISFEESGRILISSQLLNHERNIHGITGKTLAKHPDAGTARYLQYHREKCFRK